MTFRNTTIKPVYSTDTDNIVKELYIPLLKQSVSYDRAVGYFSSKILLRLIEGIDGLIKHDGSMRLVIGEVLDEDEYKAIQNGNNTHLNQKLEQVWGDIFLMAEKEELLQHRLNVLSWLVNNNRLDIRFALRRKGLFHKKIGIIKDLESNIVVFSGSMNETERAVMAHLNNPDGNSEEVDVYPSWKKEVFDDYAMPKIESFERLWKGKEPNTETIAIDSCQYEKLKSIYPDKSFPESNIEKKQAEFFDAYLQDKTHNEEKPESYSENPTIPTFFNGKPYNLKTHQLEALQSWQESDYKGIMALATGAGKTITAIHGATVIANKNRIFMVIAVPYKILADQWCDVLEYFSIFPIKCYDTRNNWHTQLVNDVSSFNLGVKNFVSVVVVNRTLTSKTFQGEIQKVTPEKLMFIGDECHHHTANQIRDKLPNAYFRIGLSATPWSKRDPLKGAELIEYYGDIVSEYSLSRALEEGILVNYEYSIYPVFFNDDEDEKYRDLTKKIGRFSNIDKLSSDERQMRDMLIFARSRLLDGLEEKFERLDEVLSQRKPGKHTLFYCGAGSSNYLDSVEDDEEERTRIVDRFSMILRANNWISSNFTYNESNADRRRIMEEFKEGEIQALLAIKVLDEGFDLPVCQEAYITASSTNERQYIQRRGRILRKSEGKELAKIHDFVILPDFYDAAYSSLVKNEIDRVEDFFKDALNSKDFYKNQTIKKILKMYKLES